MNQVFVFLRNLLGRYSPGQRVVIIILILGLFSASISLVLWANRPEFHVLYSEIDSASASRVVSELRGSKIDYELRDNGRTILVPVDQASELRLRYAEQGIVSSAVDGYEIFDETSIGMTTFMQQLNLRRALEGELTKTINQFPAVKNSRVHLVFPENDLFGKEKKGSASVVVYLHPGKRMQPEQVTGITALVANSVDQIDQDNVAVVDADGAMLTDSRSEDDILGSSGSRWDLRHRIEATLQNKVMNILDGVVGFNNSVVQVAVELNFEKIERTQEFYDSDNVAVISEERHSGSTTNSDTVDNQVMHQENEDVITNYELNKTVEHYVGNTGTIDKLSVAVLVNGSYNTVTNEAGNDERNYQPRSRQELQQIESLVRSAVGYNSDRGDIVEVRNLRFNQENLDEDREYFVEMEKREMWAGVINKGLLGLGLIAAFFIIRLMLNSTGKALQESTELLKESGNGQYQISSGSSSGGNSLDSREENIPDDAFMKKLSPEAQAQLKAKDKMTEEVIGLSKEQPEDAARLVRTWLTQMGSLPTQE